MPQDINCTRNWSVMLGTQQTDGFSDTSYPVGVLVVAAILWVAKGSGRKGGRIEPLLLFRGELPADDVICMPVTCRIVRIEPGGSPMDYSGNKLD